MADVRIPIKQFTSISFPSVCAITGLPAAEVFAFTFDGRKGALPLNQSSVRLVRQQQLTLKVLFGAMLALFAIATIQRSTPVAVGAVITTVIVLANFVTIRARLPRGKVDGKELLLQNVHSGFVDALDNPPGPHTTTTKGGKCAGCPAVAECSTEQIDTCEGHDNSELAHQ